MPKFKLSKASDWSFKSEVLIEDLESLLDFIRENGVIIMEEKHILIYDYYVE